MTFSFYPRTRIGKTFVVTNTFTSCNTEFFRLNLGTIFNEYFYVFIFSIIHSCFICRFVQNHFSSRASTIPREILSTSLEFNIEFALKNNLIFDKYKIRILTLFFKGCNIFACLSRKCTAFMKKRSYQ